ncbi:MAG TPA: CPXCG motif-containing cysteine-rich protein [Gammaproteobacteria bacterium]|nr:CPXCG motif-containing cysteine-rich protein [Gammaproteobacteria bacterium]
MLEPLPFACPCCGAPVETVVDCSIAEQDYIEDCPVCCHPLRLRVRLDEQALPVLVEVAPE